jgi:hypothetical protein
MRSALAPADDLPPWRYREAGHRRDPRSDTTTEFKISERVVASFAAKVRRPDKEDNIRIEPLVERRPESCALCLLSQ